MHEMARAGETVHRPLREVTIHAIDVVELAPPRVVLDITCSKGTYVRSLAFDLGRALGCGAHIAALRRTRTGAYTEADAVPLDEIDRERVKTALVPIARVTGMASVAVAPELERLVGLGVVLSAGAFAEAPPEPEVFQLVSQDGKLLALAGVKGSEVRYHRVFNL
jgi:tRNA pseudouridine55 synthase